MRDAGIFENSHIPVAFHVGAGELREARYAIGTGDFGLDDAALLGPRPMAVVEQHGAYLPGEAGAGHIHLHAAVTRWNKYVGYA